LIATEVEKMSDFDNKRNFRAEAYKLGLTLRRGEEITLPIYYLDLNSGALFTSCEPKKVLELVLLARKYASSESYGAHSAILQLVAKKKEIGSVEYPCVWTIPYWVEVDDEYTSISDWLAENGYGYTPQK